MMVLFTTSQPICNIKEIFSSRDCYAAVSWLMLCLSLLPSKCFVIIIKLYMSSLRVKARGNFAVSFCKIICSNILITFILDVCFRKSGIRLYATRRVPTTRCHSLQFQYYSKRTNFRKYVRDFIVCCIRWYACIGENHDDVIKWKQFPRYWSFVRGINRSPVNSPHKGQ